MKKIVYFLTFLFLFSSYFMDLAFSECSPLTPCCCQEHPGGAEKCFTQGLCCGYGDEQFWDPVSCFKFDMWVEPRSTMFTVGRKTNVNLYIHNLGIYPDNYNLTYNITSGNSALIKVDIAGFDYVKDVGPKEIRVVYPAITILESGATGNIFFNATSEGDNRKQNNATLTILPSDFPLSLPEFDFFSLFVIVVLSGIIYVYNKMRSLK